ncbi:g10911 [Coccomyxa elongata]
MQDASVSWSAAHILSFIRFIVAATCFTLPGLAHYFQDQKRHMVLTSVPFGPFFELSFPVTLLQDPVFVSVWPRQWAMYKALEIFRFEVSEQHLYLTMLLFTDIISALIATLHRWMHSHQVRCLVIGSAVSWLQTPCSLTGSGRPSLVSSTFG